MIIVCMIVIDSGNQDHRQRNLLNRSPKLANKLVMAP